MLRFDPFKIDSPCSSVDRISKDLWDGLMSPFDRNKVDVSETDNSYQIEMDIPGFDRNEISVNIRNDDCLVVSGKSEKSSESDAPERKYVVRSRSVSNFERSFSLPDNVDPSGIKASCKNGVLLVEIPKKEPPEEKNIKISVE